MAKKLNKAQLQEKAAGYNIEVPEGATNAQIEALIAAYEEKNPHSGATEDDNDTAADAKASASKEEKPAAPAKKAKQLVAKVNGVEYTFKPNTPAKLRVNGVVRTQEEIINDEDVFTALVVGGSYFVTKKK